MFVDLLHFWFGKSKWRNRVPIGDQEQRPSLDLALRNLRVNACHIFFEPCIAGAKAARHNPDSPNLQPCEPCLDCVPPAFCRLFRPQALWPNKEIDKHFGAFGRRRVTRLPAQAKARACQRAGKLFRTMPHQQPFKAWHCYIIRSQGIEAASAQSSMPWPDHSPVLSSAICVVVQSCETGMNR